MTVEISDFSLASMAALVLFLLIMLPRALFHVARVATGGLLRRPAAVDRWLLAIGIAFLLCAALAGASMIFPVRAHSLVDRSSAVALAFLFFATPAGLQVLRAWYGRHDKSVRTLSHALVALAILSLPASMGVPTAALLQASGSQNPTQPLAAAPADNPSAALANARYFTDNEFVNDPEDYPIAQFLDQNATLHFTIDPKGAMTGHVLWRDIPTFTAFWVDQTLTAVTFDGTDAFGVIVGRITNVRGNYPFDVAVFIYKLLCALILAAVTFDALIRPLVDRVQRGRRRTSR